MSDTADSQAIMLAIICFVFYFAPTFNALSRKHPNKTPVLLMNLFLGWTLVGWVVALVWSASAIKKGPSADNSSSKYSDLERLGEMRAKGLLTEAEFESEKLKLLNG
ncbi:superinfection immunity protein [Pseudomonas sp. NIBR-H-19]|uniref:superinfection immunity protein n=1 Tax=Pseudomonas sp. NIBR-H-19 TaxID=2901380 RepID=UPI001E5E4DFC|nr:superinfection immunity protein [Pseudomonas sp. NIBR-H-19]UHC81657.1 superinfection immunity protein [Pseudomonas sp. NIBR-H-19]